VPHPAFPPDPADLDRGPRWRRKVIDVPGIEFEPRPPLSAEDFRPDSECDGWSAGRVAVRSASVRGDRHRYYKQPRQDSVCSAFHDSAGAVIFAVADGVSNAEASEIGSTDACRAAAGALANQLESGPGALDFVQVARYVSGTLRRRAQTMLNAGSLPGPADAGKLLATTLVAGAAWPDRDGVSVRLFRVGDSSAWVLNTEQGQYRHLFPSPAGDEEVLVSNEVTALPGVPETLEQQSLLVVPGQVLLVGTDGFGLPLGDGDGAVGALFARHLVSPGSPLWLGHVLDFSRETFDDDRTLLALWPLPPDGTGTV